MRVRDQTHSIFCHDLSPEGVGPMNSLVTSVKKFVRPEEASAVKRFVHMAGYYRRFVPNFGSLMAPLTRLLRKSEAWKWTDEQESAFEHVKSLLSERPLLVYPNFTQPFTLETDASVIGLGSCPKPITLASVHGTGLQPVAYASKVNDPVVARYSITELECLAVVWAIKYFRPFLNGQTFTIRTGHAALKWLMTASDLAGRLHRWALILQEYQFNVEYRSGKFNVVADALSRAPILSVTANVSVTEPSVVSEQTLQLSDEELIKEQRCSNLVQKFVKCKQYKEMPIIRLNELWMIITSTGLRTILPPMLWSVVFKENIDSI